jgi:hypothetical protein|tara:strand:+ start:446 stop:745 length:300 start_codon:yes stop_codon:yes gene_type:complete
MKLDIQKFKKFLEETLWWLGEHAFLFVLGLFLLAGILVSLVYYQYVLSLQDATLQKEKSEFEFREDLFQEVIENQKLYQERFNKADSLQPRDIFRSGTN